MNLPVARSGHEGAWTPRPGKSQLLVGHRRSPQHIPSADSRITFFALTAVSAAPRWGRPLYRVARPLDVASALEDGSFPSNLIVHQRAECRKGRSARKVCAECCYNGWTYTHGRNPRCPRTIAVLLTRDSIEGGLSCSYAPRRRLKIALLVG